MDAVYGIPIIGLVIQFFGYLVAELPDIAPIMLRAATPIALGAMCGVLCERSGVVNIGIEGIMLTSAFVGWAVGLVTVLFLPTDALLPVFGISPALLVALLAAVGAGMLVSLLHAWLSISVRADQIIAGTIVNIAAFGLTGYLNTILAQGSPSGAGSFNRYNPPDEIAEIPLVGWLFDAILDQGPITIGMLAIVIVFQILLFRSRWGLRTRAVGEHPKAAETVGIDVIRLRYKNVVFAGVFAALGGAFLSMEISNSFQAEMTTGRGFIALAAMIVGRWTPLGAFGAAILFASSQALGQSINFAPPPGQLGDVLGALPGQFYDALPYLVTIVILAGVVGRGIPPAADGQPYEREATT